MIPTLLSIATVIAAVWLQVTEHSRIIGEKKMTAHIKRVWAVCRTAVFILMGLGSYALTHGSLLSAGLNIAGSLFLFPALFNRWINKAQGYPTFYIGGTGWIDIRLISAITGFSVTHLTTELRSEVSIHQSYFFHRPDYKASVLKVGLILNYSCLITSALLYGTGVILSNTN